MKTITEFLSDITKKAFQTCGFGDSFGSVSFSARPDLCQFQCNDCFACAKEFKISPKEIAEKVSAVLSENEFLSSAEFCPPGFINLSLTDAALCDFALKSFLDERLGLPSYSGKIVMDYGGPNVAKPLHIGHLRSAIIGESLKRIARTLGYEVIADVHLGDWGLQMGLVIAELSERYDIKNLPPLSASDLNEIYPFASKKSKENEEFSVKAHEITARLQSGDPLYISVWNKIMEISLSDLKENYSRLSVDFDLWYGESDAEKYVPKLLKILNDKSLLHESEGAMVVDVALPDDKIDIPPVIIKKSDNSNIYATTDLATIIERSEDFAPDAIWYIVDKRQSLHFTQVFRCAEKAALCKEGTEFLHLGFGTMNGADGKPFKTRDGGVMKLCDLLDEVCNKALSKMQSSDYVSEPDKKETAEKVALAAIKFGDLINHRSKDYIFDIDKFLSFEGKTGSYILYTVTRINSVLSKAGAEDADTKPCVISSDAERNLILTLLQIPDAFRSAFSEKAPNFIADSVYKTAAAFSQFYHDCPINSESDPAVKESRLFLCKYARRMMEKELYVLGIEPVARM